MQKKDILIITGVLFVALLSYCLIRWLSPAGGGVIIRVDGVETVRYSFREEGTYSLNGGTNLLVIQGGAAWLTEADCPDKLCVKMGKITRGGEAIVCLPNRVTVTVYGGEGGLDAVS